MVGKWVETPGIDPACVEKASGVGRCGKGREQFVAIRSQVVENNDQHEASENATYIRAVSGRMRATVATFQVASALGSGRQLSEIDYLDGRHRLP